MTLSDKKNIITIDFETHDQHLKTLGSGWVHGDIHVLGASIKKNEQPAQYYRNKQQIIDLVEAADVLVAHNLKYDLGILYMWGADIMDKLWVDTITLSKLYNNNEGKGNYGLDTLAKKYLNTEKNNLVFADAVAKHNLYKEKGKPKRCGDPKKLLRYAMENLHELEQVEPQLIEEYCNHDVEMTYKLFKLREFEVTERDSQMHKILMKMRAKGIPVDLQAVKAGRAQLIKKEEAALQKARELSGNPGFNPTAPTDLVIAYDNLNIIYPRNSPTPKDLEKMKALLEAGEVDAANELRKGRPSITAAWLDSQEDPLSKAIRTYRHYNKARNDFCDKLLEYQELLPEDKRGRIYPEFNLYGAEATGRFSCANPNCQQLPSRDPELGPIVRGFYVPFDGDTFYHMDIKSQELRMQVHYAVKLALPGATELANKYNTDEDFDMHSEGAKIMFGVKAPTKIERQQSKAINLGLSYGMGLNKLAESLGVSKDKAKDLKKRYNKALPYLGALSKLTTKIIEERGYIKTLNGRKLRNEHGKDVYTGEKYSFGYKAINKLIQGSSADQIINVMLALDNAGIPMLLCEHDALAFSLPSPELAAKAQEIMETAVEFEVPMPVDAGSGSNWAEAK